MATHRITVTFPESEFLKIQENAQSKKMTLAQSIRQLIDFGLQVETNLKAANTRPKSPTIKDAVTDFSEKDLLKNQLESCYLNRYIFNWLLKDDPNREVVLQTIKKKVEELTQKFPAQ